MIIRFFWLFKNTRAAPGIMLKLLEVAQQAGLYDKELKIEF